MAPRFTVTNISRVDLFRLLMLQHLFPMEARWLSVTGFYQSVLFTTYNVVIGTEGPVSGRPLGASFRCFGA
jgi:hypothetical protein